MRGLLKYGIPAAAGIGTTGYALMQGEDLGSALLAGAAGTLGGAAGLLGARKLAGKYAPALQDARENATEKILQGGIRLEDMVGNLPATREKGIRATTGRALANQAVNVANQIAQINLGERAVGKGIAGMAVPASALVAGLGGVAAGAIPGSLGVPGFQQSIDPENYGSSNTMGARAAQTTLGYY